MEKLCQYLIKLQKQGKSIQIGEISGICVHPKTGELLLFVSLLEIS